MLFLDKLIQTVKVGQKHARKGMKMIDFKTVWSYNEATK